MSDPRSRIEYSNQRLKRLFPIEYESLQEVFFALNGQIETLKAVKFAFHETVTKEDYEFKAALDKRHEEFHQEWSAIHDVECNSYSGESLDLRLLF